MSNQACLITRKIAVSEVLESAMTDLATRKAAVNLGWPPVHRPYYGAWPVSSLWHTSTAFAQTSPGTKERRDTERKWAELS